MENNVLSFLRRYDMTRPGDRVICAVSGGADSMALLWCMWMLREKLSICVEAAHFNHRLRGEESDRDEQFVRAFCAFHDIPLHVGSGQILPGKKGLEAAARDARYAFLRSLGGVVATAHTADDNAETVLMHLIRGTGLRGLGGITPKSENLIRPMLEVTRQQVEAYLAENWIRYVDDSSNKENLFLRNRIRHGIMPLLKQENPSIGSNLSALAQRLREDEAVLRELAMDIDATNVEQLREAMPALRRRALAEMLKQGGLPEPNASHIAQAEALVFSGKPSSFARFPGDVILRRNYQRLEISAQVVELEPAVLKPGMPLRLADGTTVRLEDPNGKENTPWSFEICPKGDIIIRGKLPGDSITLSGGSKSLKKLFIDRKIPAFRRQSVPVAADENGILGICGIGANVARTTGGAPVRITFATDVTDSLTAE